MKMQKSLILIALFFCFVMSSTAQSFNLETFNKERLKVKEELNLKNTKATTFNKCMTQLDKDLLQLNDELNGKSKSQVKSLIEKKFKKANESLNKVLSPDEMTVVQNLNDAQMTTITKGLIGTHGILETKGLIGTHGKVDTKNVQGNIDIVVGTAKN